MGRSLFLDWAWLSLNLAPCGSGRVLLDQCFSRADKAKAAPLSPTYLSPVAWLY